MFPALTRHCLAVEVHVFDLVKDDESFKQLQAQMYIADYVSSC